MGIVNRFFDFLFSLDENFILTNLAHTADVIFLDAQGVAEKVGAFAASDASAGSNGERASAAQIAEADVVECGDHVFCFHYE